MACCLESPLDLDRVYQVLVRFGDVDVFVVFAMSETRVLMLIGSEVERVVCVRCAERVVGLWRALSWAQNLVDTGV